MAINNMVKKHVSIDEKEEAKFDEVFVEKIPAKVVEAPPVSEYRILAIAAKNRKGKVMLADMKARGLEPITVIEADLEKNVTKTVRDIVKSEIAKDNEYTVAYVSVSNSDINKNPELAKLNGNVPELSINLYFDGHDDQEISNKAYKYKIQ